MSQYFRQLLSQSIEETLPNIKDDAIAEMDGEEIKITTLQKHWTKWKKI